MAPEGMSSWNDRSTDQRKEEPKTPTVELPKETLEKVKGGKNIWKASFTTVGLSWRKKT